MPRFKSVVRNSGYLVGSKLVSRTLFTIFSLYAAVELGPGLYGSLAFTLATVELINTIGDVGLTRYGTRELVRKWSDRAVLGGEIMLLQLATSFLFATLGMVVVLAFISGDEMSTLMTIGMVAVVFWGAVSATESLIMASEKFLYSALFSLLGRVVFVGAGAAAIFLGLPIEYVMLAFLGGVVIEAVVRIAWVSTRITRLSFRFNLAQLKALLLATAPFAIGAVSSIVILQAGTILLGILDDAVAVGVYSVAFSLFVPFIWVPLILARTLFPGLTDIYAKDPNTARIVSWQWYRLMAIAGIPLAAMATILAEPIMGFLPESYHDSSTIFIILMWTMPMTLLTAVEINIMQIIDRENLAARFNLVGAVVTVAMNFVLIPYLGGIGAALALLVGLMTREVMSYIDIYKNFMRKQMIVLFIRPVTGGIVMLALAYLIRPYNPWLAGAAAAGAYLLVMAVTRAVGLGELKKLARS